MQADLQGGGPPVRCEALPLFYMNDYSRLGLRVDACDTARRILAENRSGVVQDDGGWQVTLDSAADVRSVVALLNTRGVACDIADLAGQMYQG
jgi:hypothetical protein